PTSKSLLYFLPQPLSMSLVLTVYTPLFSNCLFPNPVLNGPHLRLIIHYSYTLCKWRGDIGKFIPFLAYPFRQVIHDPSIPANSSNISPSDPRHPPPR
ncbi:hypothetical protein AVEN_143007-1, partial [Araneus ventricosus]